jgi:hypothetical protein
MATNKAKASKRKLKQRNDKPLFPNTKNVRKEAIAEYALEVVDGPDNRQRSHRNLWQNRGNHQ